MKLTELKIARRNSWDDNPVNNPLVCTVKLSGEKAIIETALNDDDLQRMIDLVQSIVADAAKRNVDAFVSEVRQVEAAKAQAVLA